MKKFLQSIAVTASLALILAACNSNPVSMKPVSNEDTVGFAQFQAWKAMEQQPVAPIQQQAASAPVKNYSMNSASTHEAKTTKKKGWSKAAKYSVIGGTGGAVLGAIINKKSPVKGAVIGAVILGGGGYIFGRSKDKKEGRY